MRTVAGVALALLATPVAASNSNSMTLAEARRLSAQQLAERLLGAAGASGQYVEANVRGNGGLMIGMPGLNSIELYQRPKSAGFAGICEVDGVHIEFSASRRETPGDPPHRVSDFWQLKRFAILSPTDKRIADADWDRESAACAKLGPVANRTNPVFFATPGDRIVDAYFAMRAVAKAQQTPISLGTALTCKADNTTRAVCTDPAQSLRAIPIRQIHFMKVERCATSLSWCVHTAWEKSSSGKDPQVVELDIHTDATHVDPPTDFNVTAVAITVGVWIVD